MQPLARGKLPESERSPAHKPPQDFVLAGCEPGFSASMLEDSSKPSNCPPQTRWKLRSHLDAPVVRCLVAETKGLLRDVWERAHSHRSQKTW